MNQRRPALILQIVLFFIIAICIAIIALIYRLNTNDITDKAPAQTLQKVIKEKGSYLDKLEKYEIKSQTIISQASLEEQDTASLVKQTSEESNTSISHIIDEIVAKSLAKSNSATNGNETVRTPPTK